MANLIFRRKNGQEYLGCMVLEASHYFLVQSLKFDILISQGTILITFYNKHK